MEFVIKIVELELIRMKIISINAIYSTRLLHTLYINKQVGVKTTIKKHNRQFMAGFFYNMTNHQVYYDWSWYVRSYIKRKKSSSTSACSPKLLFFFFLISKVFVIIFGSKIQVHLCL